MVLTADERAAQLGQTLRTLPERLRIFRITVKVFTSVINSFGIWLVLLLLLFVLHQLFLWIDQDPDVAFERAALVTEVAEVSYDTTRSFYNSGIDIFNAGVIPLWNGASFYVGEPVIMLILEVFSFVFAQKHYEGVYDEKAFPYIGLSCTDTARSAQFCGRYAFYKSRMDSEAKAKAFINESATFTGARRHLLQLERAGFGNGSKYYDLFYEGNITLTLRSARRLSEQVGEVIPPLNTGDMTESLEDLSGFGLTLGAPVSDVGAGLAYKVGESAFSVVADAVFSLLKGAIGGLKMIISSGILTTVVSIGVDFVIIYITEIQLPLLFAALDGVMCLLDMFNPSGWKAQLECVEQNCFTGSDATADIMVFYSMPILIHRFASIVDAVVNSQTGRRFVAMVSGSAVSAKGRIRDENGNVIEDLEESETAESASPFEFSLADSVSDVFYTPGVERCADCYVCKASAPAFEHAPSGALLFTERRVL